MIQKFLLSLLATVVTTNIINSFPAEAQQTGKVPRIDSRPKHCFRERDPLGSIPGGVAQVRMG
jgi:hypothetical protein